MSTAKDIWEILPCPHTHLEKCTICCNKEILSGGFFMLCSAGMTLLNKAVMSNYEFNYPNIIMAIQMLVTTSIIRLLWTTGLIQQEIHFLWREKYLPLFVVSFYFNTILSLNALHGMNIPMYGAIKRCTALVNLIFSVVFLRKEFPTLPKLVAILLITLGCTLQGFGEVHNEVTALVFGLGAIVVQAMYMTLAEKLTVNKNWLSLIYSCSICAFPLFVGAAYTFNEFQEVDFTEYYENDIFFVMLAVLIVGGTLLTLSTILSTKINSALSTSLLGSLKALIQTASGILLFQDVYLSPTVICGLTMNLTGTFMYAFLKTLPSSSEQSDHL